MNKNFATGTVIATLALVFSSTAIAGPIEAQLASYATAAKAANAAASSFDGFSAARGNTLHTQTFSGGKPGTPSCTACHGKDTRSAGQMPTGKSIDPMALSASPSRYADPAKVEKWFKRNCMEVLGRVCTPLEKGDWLTFMASQ